LDNPYAPSVTRPDPCQPPPRSVTRWGIVAIIAGSLVIANYLTATATYWQTNPFMNWVFATSPIAIASQIILLSDKPSRIPAFIASAVALTIGLALGFAWISWFSSNPYEVHVLMNVFFGPFGWMQWMWFALTGLLPLLYLVPWIREQLSLRRLLATLTILAYLHNAICVILSCHELP